MEKSEYGLERNSKFKKKKEKKGETWEVQVQ